MLLVSHPRLSHNLGLKISTFRMFATTSEFEFAPPRSLREPGGKYWAAFKLTTEAPWFLVTLAMPGEEGLQSQTVCVSWESTLLSLLESVGPRAVVSIRRIELKSYQPGAWTMRDIIEVWHPAAAEREQAGILLFRFAGDSGLWNSHLEQVETDFPGRELVVRPCGW